MPCVRSIWFFGVCLSSSGSVAVSAMMMKIVLYLLVDAPIIFVTCSVVGIICGVCCVCIFGLSNGIWFVLQNTAYVSMRFLMYRLLSGLLLGFACL